MLFKWLVKDRSDDAEIRLLRTMIQSADSQKVLGIITEKEYADMMRYIESRISELEIDHGLQ